MDKRGIVDNIRQEFYELRGLDRNRTSDLWRRDPPTWNGQTLTFGRERLPVNRVPEGHADTDKVLLPICKERLTQTLTSDCTDSRHRIRQNSNTGNSSIAKPRSITAKLTTYETGRAIFGTKRNLKGMGRVIIANLTKRRSVFLQKAPRGTCGYMDTWWTNCVPP